MKTRFVKTIYMLIYEYTNILAIILLASLVFLAKPVAALELVVIDQVGCVYCERFEREIAPAYPTTAMGKKAPLRRVDLHGKWPEDLSNIQIERFTPTFILVHDNQELGRLRGYPGDEHIWFLLEQMFESAEISLDDTAESPGK